MKKGFTYYLGTGFILLSLVGLIFTFYPIIQAYFFPTPIPAVAIADEEGFILSIPAIQASGEVVENVDPFNRVEYSEALKKGIAHAKGTYLPGESGTVFLFAHSSGMPWELTRYNTIFLRLGELKKNDNITIYFKGQEYMYNVRESREVWPQEIGFLKDIKKDQLILQTCTPIGTDLKRLLIFADPV